MSGPGSPAFRSYARRHGLLYFEDWGVPQATQLLRHGFAQRVPNLALGELPHGLGDGWLAHAGYATTGGAGVEQHEFTVAISRVPKSTGFAVRVVCHDRGLDDEERSNPNEDAQIIELADRDLEVESVRFLERYAVATDSDQDQLRAWQLFSPALIHWLTEDAPSRFSFELQEGALCCFVAGLLTDEGRVDELCAAAARVHRRVDELAESGGRTASARPTRAALVDAELAARPFGEAPASVARAARAFGLWGLVTGRGWRLGAEAFFRAYARDRGFARIDHATFRAGGHLSTPIPGEITQIGAGRLEGESGPPTWLVLTKDRPGSGWMVLVVDPPNRDLLYSFVGLPETAAAEADGFEVAADDRSLIVFKPDGGPRRRSRAALDAFLEPARRVAHAAIEAAGPEL
jgi:hypothetical protein